jgi:hypothetical protein
MSTQELIPDTTGVEMPDLETVHRSAPQIVREVQQEADQTTMDWQGWWIDVVDRSGDVLLSIPLDTILQ